MMMTFDNASPGTSTPCQKLSTPNKTALPAARKRSSIYDRGVPSAGTERGARHHHRRHFGVEMLPQSRADLDRSARQLNAARAQAGDFHPINLIRQFLPQPFLQRTGQTETAVRNSFKLNLFFV